MTELRAVDCVWQRTAPAGQIHEPLKGEEQAEVVVVGGGFCGLSAALHLAEAGLSAVVLETHTPGWGASGRNGGQVIPGLKKDPDDLAKLYGVERGGILTDLTGNAPDLVFELIRRYRIQCSAQRTGWIQLALGGRGLGEIERRAMQWQRRGIDVDVLDRDQVGDLTGARGYAGGLLDRRGGNLNPLAYARGLAAAAVSAGARVYAHSPAVSIKRSKDKWVVVSSRGTVTTDKILLCTNAYTDDIWPGLKTSIIPFVSGAVATEPLPDDVRRSILQGRQAAADNGRLLSWFGLDRDGRLIFGGRTGMWSESNSPSDYQLRIKRMHQVFPQVKHTPVPFYWSGKVALTADGLPHIHKLAPDLYTGLGFNGRGVAMATLMGKLLAACAERDGGDTSLPLTGMKSLPFHAVRKPVVQLVVCWKKLMDWINP